MSDDYVDRATTLKGIDAPSETRLDGSETKQNYYSRLAVANSLDWNGKWRDEWRATRKDSVAIVDAIASSLELTPYQKERAQHYFDSLPSDYNEAYSTSLLALCVCGISGKLDGRNYHPNRHHSNGPEPTHNNKFAQLTYQNEIAYSELWSCWRNIEEEIL